MTAFETDISLYMLARLPYTPLTAAIVAKSCRGDWKQAIVSWFHNHTINHL